MISNFIKRMVELKLGQTIKYPKDCDTLSNAIYAKCRQRISPSTLKRLFGFLKSGAENVCEYEPRLMTLDIIANFLDFQSFDDLLSDVVDNKPKKEQRIELVECATLKRGVKFQVRFGSITYIEIECVGKNKFRLIHHEKSGLVNGDLLEISKIELGVPLLVQHIKRAELNLSGVLLGKVSGVQSIRKIQ